MTVFRVSDGGSFRSSDNGRRTRTVCRSFDLSAATGCPPGGGCSQGTSLIEQPWTNRLGVQKISESCPVLLVEVSQGARFSHRPVPQGSCTPDDRRHPGLDVFESVNCLDDGGESLVRPVDGRTLARTVGELCGFSSLFLIFVPTSVRADTAAVQLLAQFIRAQIHATAGNPAR